MAQKLNLLLLFFCINLALVLPVQSVRISAAADSVSFSGTWAANGTKEILSMGTDRNAALFRLSGHVNLKNEVGEKKDYWSECIGLADTKTGSKARCVWRSSDGQEIYLVLESNNFTEKSKISGKLVGGTGAAAGITGTIQFIWSSLSSHSENKGTSVGGYAKELSGTYQLP